MSEAVVLACTNYPECDVIPEVPGYCHVCFFHLEEFFVRELKGDRRAAQKMTPYDYILDMHGALNLQQAYQLQQAVITRCAQNDRPSRVEPTRMQKFVYNLKELFVGLAIIGVIGFVAWSGIHLAAMRGL